jgi:hypothetical protein
MQTISVKRLMQDFGLSFVEASTLLQAQQSKAQRRYVWLSLFLLPILWVHWFAPQHAAWIWWIVVPCGLVLIAQVALTYRYTRTLVLAAARAATQNRPGSNMR